jgi:hypothetical protein
MHPFFIAAHATDVHPRHSMNAYDNRKQRRKEKPNMQIVGIVPETKYRYKFSP